jgi:hypothetical protein
MNKMQFHIIESTLKELIQEAPAQETDNADQDSDNSIFTPAEEKFLGKFDAYGTQHLGIIYSVSDIGIREFIGRSGKDLNITPAILLNLIQQKIIKIVPYTGFGRNNDYTIELRLSLDDIKGFGAEDKEKLEQGTSNSAPPPPSEPSAPPAPEVSWVVKYGDILKESVNIAKNILTNTKFDATKLKANELKQLPEQYVHHIAKIVTSLDKSSTSLKQKQQIIESVLAALQVKLNLSVNEIRKSYEFHKSNEKLQNILENK